MGAVARLVTQHHVPTGRFHAKSPVSEAQPQPTRQVRADAFLKGSSPRSRCMKIAVVTDIRGIKARMVCPFLPGAEPIVPIMAKNRTRGDRTRRRHEDPDQTSFHILPLSRSRLAIREIGRNTYAATDLASISHTLIAV